MKNLTACWLWRSFASWGGVLLGASLAVPPVRAPKDYFSLLNPPGTNYDANPVNRSRFQCWSCWRIDSEKRKK
jgi:hypothetical protein